MVEFFHANTHKAFHIGHLRNISFAEALNRLLESAGHRVYRVNYQGDIGPHVAKAIWAFLHTKKKPPAGQKGRFLAELYAAGHRASEDPKIKEEIDDINRKLYAGDPALLKVWKKTRQWSLDDYEDFYKEFGVKFDRLYFESEAEKPGTQLTRQLLKQGILKLSEGAIIADLEKEGLATVVLLTGRQTPTYAAKDLGLALMEDKEFHPDRIIHVVGAEQTLYFQQLFKILEQAFPQIAKKQFHLAYGLVTLPTGKMSSREGNVILYEDLMRELLQQAEKITREKNPKLSPARLKKIARSIAFAALRYPMVQVSPEKQIVYNPQAAVSLEGNTAPYLQYTHARACSIMKKGKIKSLPPLPSPLPELSPTETVLLKSLLSFPQVVEAAARDLRPHYLADFVFQLALQFNAFYQSHPVLQADQPARAFRLHLVQSVQSVLKQSLTLLGIDAPEEM